MHILPNKKCSHLFRFLDAITVRVYTVTICNTTIGVFRSERRGQAPNVREQTIRVNDFHFPRITNR